MKESKTITTAPKVQKLERLQTIEKEHKDALERAVSLNIPHAVTTPEEQASPEEQPSKDKEAELPQVESEHALKTVSKSSGTNWDEIVKKLFNKSESGELVLNTEANALK